MSTENQETETPVTVSTVLEFFRMKDARMALETILFAVIVAVVYALVSTVPMPFVMEGLFTLGLVPALALIAFAGAIRGPIAGLLAGYLGEVIYGLLVYNVVVTLTLPALAYGALGLVVGMASYELSSGRSLAKMSLLSAFGLVMTALLLVIIGMVIEGYATMVAIGFVLLPVLTDGLPTVIFLTPVLARIWSMTAPVVASRMTH
jgi:uncharacterized membrane protein